MWKRYTKTLWERALKDTWRDSTGVHWPNRIVQLLLVAAPFGAALAWRHWRPGEMSDAAFYGTAFTVISALAGFGFVVAVFFLWHLIFAAPYQLWKEERRARIIAETGREPEFHDAWDQLAETDRHARGAVRDTGADEALAYIAFGEWGRDFSEVVIALFEGKVGNPCTPFRQAALEGKITVWGMLRINKVWDKIPASHWAKHGLDEEMFKAGNPATRWTDIHGSDGEEYHNLMVDRAEIERVWPA